MEVVFWLRVKPFEVDVENFEILCFLISGNASCCAVTYFVAAAFILYRCTVRGDLILLVLLPFAHDALEIVN